MNDGVSVREFARQIGKSHVWVLKLLKEGKLPRNEDGTIPLVSGIKAYEDFLSQPVKKGRPKKDTSAAEQKPARHRGRPKKEKPPIIEDVLGDTDESDNITPPAPPSLSSRSAEAVNINTALNKAKLAEKTYQARLRELDYKARNGELIEKEAVEKEAQWLAEQVKSKLLAVPPRISSMCEGRIARDIEEIITDAINDALKELQKCKYLDNGG